MKKPKLYDVKLTATEETIINSLRRLDTESQFVMAKSIFDLAAKRQEDELAVLFSEGRRKHLHRRMKCRGLTVIDGEKMPKQRKAQEKKETRPRYIEFGLMG